MIRFAEDLSVDQRAVPCERYYAAFDALRAIGLGVALSEHRHRGATRALMTWADRRKLEVTHSDVEGCPAGKISVQLDPLGVLGNASIDVYLR